MLLLALTSCGGRDQVQTTLFAGPGQVALAGASFERVFVANRGTDSVQVLALQPSLAASDFVPSAARYFPLNLRVGVEPTELSSAGQGRYVFVLDAVSNSVSVIDAIELSVLHDAQQQRLAVSLGNPESQARGIVGHASATCTATHALDKGACVARAYVTQKAVGSVSVVDLRRADDGQLSLVVEDSIVVGGSPEALTTGPLGSLFITDDAAPSLVRVQLSADAARAPVIDRFAIDAVASSVAVTANAVAVTRPTLGDVVVLGVTGDGTASVESGSLSMRDGDATLTPLPRCLAPCADTTNACAAAHPADRALCVDANGFAASPLAAPYGGLPTQGAPQAITALRAEALDEAFAVHCPQSSATLAYSSGFAVASLNGAVEFIGIKDDGVPEMVDVAFCQAPKLVAIAGAIADISTLLGPCPSAPGRRRFACATSGAAEGGALVMRGAATDVIGMQWEGILPMGEGEAFVGDDGLLRHASRDATDFAAVALLRPRGSAASGGDVFEVLSRPNTEIVACQEALAQMQSSAPSTLTPDSLCTFERRILALREAADGSASPSALMLDAPLPAACFPQGVRYRLRAGDVFLVGRLDALERLLPGSIERVAPGGRYGPGTSNAVPLPIAFSLRPDLPLGEANACQRYLADGRSAKADAPWRSRLGQSGFRVDDPARSLQMAATYDGSGRVLARVGFLPHGLLFVPSSSPGGARLVVSYAGSNALFVTPARNSRDVQGESVEGRGRLFTN